MPHTPANETLDLRTRSLQHRKGGCAGRAAALVLHMPNTPCCPHVGGGGTVEQDHIAPLRSYLVVLKLHAHVVKQIPSLNGALARQT